MFTVCPNCHRQFRIYAEHLAAAAGQVRCGFCHQQFNAIERLHDKPLATEQAVELLDQAPESLQEPQFDIADVADVEQDAIVDTVINKHDDDVDIELKRAIDEIGVQQQADVPVQENQQAPPAIDVPAEPLLTGAEPERVKQTEYTFQDEQELLEQPPFSRPASFHC